MSDCNIHSWSSTNPDKECPQCRQLMIGREWEQDSRLEKWFPITAEELKRLQDRLQYKSEDLAAANAEIARLRGHLTEVKVAMATLIDNQEEVEEELLNERSRAEAAERERDAALKDAERYRWLRDFGDAEMFLTLTAEELDAAIDAARKA